MQILPFASEQTLAILEKNISECASMTDLMHQGLSASQITERLLADIGASNISSSMVPLYGPCEASALKQRMKRAVASLGAQEVESILEEEGKIEARISYCSCNFLNKSFVGIHRPLSLHFLPSQDVAKLRIPGCVLSVHHKHLQETFQLLSLPRSLANSAKKRMTLEETRSLEQAAVANSTLVPYCFISLCNTIYCAKLLVRMVYLS